MYLYNAKFLQDPDLGNEKNILHGEREPTGEYLHAINGDGSRIMDNFFQILTDDPPTTHDSTRRYSNNTYSPIKEDVNVVFLPASRIVGDLINPSSQLIDFADSVQERYTEAIFFLKNQCKMLSLWMDSDSFDERSFYKYADYLKTDQFGKLITKDVYSGFSFKHGDRPEDEIENTHTYLELACSTLSHFKDDIESCTPNLKNLLDKLNQTTDEIPKTDLVTHLLDHRINFEKIYNAIADLTSFWIITEVIGDHFDKSISLNSDGKIIIYDETGKQLPLKALSSGEKQLMMLYWKILNSMKRDVNENIVIIDEPELSLHISWQRDFVENLLDILVHQRKFGDEADGGYKVKIIIATHSPSILANQFEFAYELGSSDGA